MLSVYLLRNRRYERVKNQAHFLENVVFRVIIIVVVVLVAVVVVIL